jgi:hypothetical protein
MGYEGAFRANDSLIKRIGEGNAHLVWAMALYLEEPDIEALASEALTDGPNDKKIDFIYLDRDAKCHRALQNQPLMGALEPATPCG